MCAHIGHDVVTLVRIRIGCLDLTPLTPGEWRILPPNDIARLMGPHGVRS
jgi:16S rRNA U516 pseudouridylate synthase RsuA-like enzyme